MKKVRVFELAKDFGIKGPEMAKVLRDLGFDFVKSHMTVLDDANEMMVLARLDTQGHKRKPIAEDPAAAGPAKKKSLGSVAEDDTQAAPPSAASSATAVPGKKELPKKPLPPKLPERKPLKRFESLDDDPQSKQVAASVAPLAEPKKTATPTGLAPASAPQEIAAQAPAAEVTAVSAQAVSAQAVPTRALPASVAPSALAAPAPGAPVSNAQTTRAAAASMRPAPTSDAPGKPPLGKPSLGMPPLGKPPLGKPPLGKPSLGMPPLGKPPLGKPPLGKPPLGKPPLGKPPLGKPAPGSKAPTGTALGKPALGRHGQTGAAHPPAESAVDGTAASSDSSSAVDAAQLESAGSGMPGTQSESGLSQAQSPAGPIGSAGNVRRLLVPQKMATVIRRIELPQETIRDATRRSAPASERDLRRAALQKMQQRTATRSPMVSGQRRGPQSGPVQRPGQRPDPRFSGPKRRPATSADPAKEIKITPPVSIKSFSEALGIKVTELLTTLMLKLKIAGKNINSYLSQDEVELVAIELERNVKIVEQEEIEEQMIAQLVHDAANEAQILRAPVVTFMGHVDHGKTSLMDALRTSDVARVEAGGITQHIGAYKVRNPKGEFVILDTPGHAAFTAMRARGAELTDLVVLVVAGDDGVMPQTEEAINHAKAAKVPVIVAITKCDLPRSNPMQVKQQLMIKGLQPEEWGGSTGVIEVSSVTKVGLDNLVDRIMLDALILDLKARPEAPGKGVVVESRQSPEQGVVVTILVTDGTLRIKDQIVCGESFARVRAMMDDRGKQLQEAGPSMPVTVFGLDRLPSPGDKLFVVEDARKAREVVEDRQRRIRELSMAERSAVTLETLSAKLAERNIQEIKIILKADAMGSLEPLRKCLEELSTPEVRVNLVHSALGGINETDVSLAQASGAVIVGFNTVADSSARQAAERANVEIRYYEVIYALLDQVKAAMEGMLKPAEVESVVGHAEVRALFKSSKFGTIAGCYVTDGICKRNAKTRLSRDSAVIYTGKVASLRREKDEAREVRAGFECGMTLQDYQDLRVGDIIEFIQVDLVRRSL
ncbi:MAG: translation initiation factor IF-2 [Planctomycetes bacterium]|nr:translation initiation factor IF-2 [Planctomycetota bacterium]